MARDTRYSIFYSHLIPSGEPGRVGSNRVESGRVRPSLTFRDRPRNRSPLSKKKKKRNKEGEREKRNSEKEQSYRFTRLAKLKAKERYVDGQMCWMKEGKEGKRASCTYHR